MVQVGKCWRLRTQPTHQRAFADLAAVLGPNLNDTEGSAYTAVSCRLGDSFGGGRNDILQKFPANPYRCRDLVIRSGNVERASGPLVLSLVSAAATIERWPERPGQDPEKAPSTPIRGFFDQDLGSIVIA